MVSFSTSMESFLSGVMGKTFPWSYWCHVTPGGPKKLTRSTRRTMERFFLLSDHTNKLLWNVISDCLHKSISISGSAGCLGSTYEASDDFEKKYNYFLCFSWNYWVLHKHSLIRVLKWKQIMWVSNIKLTGKPCIVLIFQLFHQNLQGFPCKF